MKTLATATLAAIVAATSLAGYLQHVAVDMSDSRQNYPLRVARGEVVDLSVDFFDEGAPIGFESGASATLHTRTNSMDAAYSWQTSGSVSSNAALFVLDVDAVLPAASGEWTVVVEGGGRVLARAGGQAYVRGGAAASVAADPVSALSGYATTGYVAQAVAAIDVTESDPVWEAEKDGYARAGDLGSAAFVDTPRKYALDATNIVSITIQPLTTSDWQANYIGGFAISHPDYGSVSLSFPDDFTETESGWFGSVEMKKTAPRQFPRYFGSVLITNLVFGAELSTMTSSAVECSMDCFADWQGDSDNIHFAFYTRNNWHDGWMSVGEAADLSASRVAAAATNYTDAAIAAIDIPDPDLSFTNDFLKAESDPVWSEWVAARTNGAGWFYAETAGTAYEAQEAINAGKLGGNESSFFARASDLAAAASAATNYTDEAVARATGNYGAVSNRAMRAALLDSAQTFTAPQNFARVPTVKVTGAGNPDISITLYSWEYDLYSGNSASVGIYSYATGESYHNDIYTEGAKSAAANGETRADFGTWGTFPITYTADDWETSESATFTVDYAEFYYSGGAFHLYLSASSGGSLSYTFSATLSTSYYDEGYGDDHYYYGYGWAASTSSSLYDYGRDESRQHRGFEGVEIYSSGFEPVVSTRLATKEELDALPGYAALASATNATLSAARAFASSATNDAVAASAAYSDNSTNALAAAWRGNADMGLLVLGGELAVTTNGAPAWRTFALPVRCDAGLVITNGGAVWRVPAMRLGEVE